MKRYKYIEWLDAEEMHAATLDWFSELKFIKDEQLFLNSLVKSYTLQLIDTDVYDDSTKIIQQLQHAESDIVPLFKKVQVHENQLEIMVDGIDQLKMEKAYVETHRQLKIEMSAYLQRYRGIKEKLFKLIAAIMKKEKQKRLLGE